MADSQDPKNKQPKEPSIPSPPLPHVPSPPLPKVPNAKGGKATPHKSDPPTQAPKSHPDSFHFAGGKADKPEEDAPTTSVTQKQSVTPASQPSPKGTAPRPFSPAAVPSPKGKTAVPSPSNTKHLSEALEQRPLSIEEKEKLHGTGPLQGLQRFLEILEPIVSWLMRISMLFVAMAMAFLLLNFFRGNLAPTSPLAQNADLIHLIKIAGSVLEVSLVVLAATILISWYDTSAVAIAVLAIGALLHFGTPLLLFGHIGKSTMTALIALPLRQAGVMMMVLGAINYAFNAAMWISALPERMRGRADIGVAQKAEAAQQRVAKNANAFSPCWKLPYCREVIRKQCPAYLARTTCWKFGRGCYCDEEMISRIIRGESLDVIKAPTRMSRRGKPPCGRCYIYLEHQAHKFRLLSPMAVPLTVIIVYFLWPTYTKLFAQFNRYSDKFWALLSFKPQDVATGVLKAGSQSYNADTLSPDQVTHAALVIFGVLLGFLLLIYISKFIEWMVYKAKW